LWIARIMITWGVISTATMWVNGPSSFYLVRVLLGIAEAGFFPGIILYLTAWFPKQQRARATSWFMIAITFASIFGNPISGAILENCDGLAGWKGWQWLFLLEGLPTIFIGCMVPFILQDKPADARWLAPEERAWLEEELELEDKQRSQTGGGAHWTAMLDWRVLLLIVLYSSVAIGTNGMGAYLPTLVKERFDAPVEAIAGATPGDGSKGLFRIGLLSALPHLSALFAMVIMSRISDKTGWRSVLVAFVAFASGLGWLGASQAESPYVALACLCVAQAGMMAMLPIFWTLPPLFLGGTVYSRSSTTTSAPSGST
jgi:ACS family tartrate transporter-like MFS transporter